MDIKEENNFSERLTRLMIKESGHSKAYTAFGTFCGVGSKNIENYVKKKSSPNIKVVTKIAKECGVSVGWLAAGEEPDKIASYAKVTQLATNNHMQEITEWLATTDESDAYWGILKIKLMSEAPEFAEWLKKRKSENYTTIPAQHSNRQIR